MTPTRQMISDFLEKGHRLMTERAGIEKDIAELKKQIELKETKLREVNAGIKRNENTLAMRCSATGAVPQPITLKGRTPPNRITKGKSNSTKPSNTVTIDGSSDEEDVGETY